jgi:hypothetical protein
MQNDIDEQDRVVSAITEAARRFSRQRRRSAAAWRKRPPGERFLGKETVCER